jgi:hypothetical protein
MAKGAVMAAERIETKILLVRGKKVMVDADLAELYDVPTKRLNEQIKRNKERFPEDFPVSPHYQGEGGGRKLRPPQHFAILAGAALRFHRARRHPSCQCAQLS